jgi:Bacterial capsule synthesis protein PGA_cap
MAQFSADFPADFPDQEPPRALVVSRASGLFRVQHGVRQFLGLGLAVATLGGLLFLGVTQENAGALSATNTGQEPSPTTPEQVSGNPSTTTPGPTDSSWNILFGGDSLLVRRGTGNRNPFAKLSPQLDTASLAMINVETAITNSTTRQTKEFTFNSPPRFARLMAAAGVDVGSLANNHAMDMGDQGMLDTIDALQDAGVVPVGAGVNLAAAVKPSLHLVGSTRVAIFAASQIIPAPSWIATPTRPGIASAGKHSIDTATEHLFAAVQQARATNDVVFVFMHWGQERESCPTDIQIRVAKRLREAGATAVIGAHPHVLQPIVADDDGLIAYSLGNFMWDPRSGVTADSGILELRFDGPQLIDTIFHPHRLDGNGWAAAVSDEASQLRIQKQVKKKCRGADGSRPWPGN